jgi:hypothetical protein
VEGERCFLFWAWLVAIPVLSTGFPALIHTSLTDTAVELTISQWKAKRYEAVVDTKTCVETQTDDKIPITDESTQTETHRDEQALHNPTTQVRERSTQTIRNFTE